MLVGRQLQSSEQRLLGACVIWGTAEVSVTDLKYSGCVSYKGIGVVIVDMPYSSYGGG